MPQTATIPTGGGGVQNLSTPVKLALIGGVAGLAFFLWRRAQTSAPSTGVTNFGIPNTAIMLGSLQQEMLDLKGQVGAGDIGIENLVTGGFENLGAQIDAQTAAIQQGLGSLQVNVINNQNANTQSILDSLSARFDVLNQLVSTSSAAEKAAFDAFTTATQQGLDRITAQQNIEAAAIGALGTNVTAQQQAIIQRLQILQVETGAIAGQVIPVVNMGSGFFVGTDRRIHIGAFQGTGQPGWGGGQGMMADPTWAVGSSSPDPTVFLRPNPNLQYAYAPPSQGGVATA